MVHPVHEEVHPLGARAAHREMEEEPVEPVLEQRPEQVAPHHPGERDRRGDMAQRGDHREGHQGEEEHRRGGRVDMREPLEEIRAEHPRRALLELGQEVLTPYREPGVVRLFSELIVLELLVDLVDLCA